MHTHDMHIHTHTYIHITPTRRHEHGRVSHSRQHKSSVQDSHGPCMWEISCTHSGPPPKPYMAQGRGMLFKSITPDHRKVVPLSRSSTLVPV